MYQYARIVVADAEADLRQCDVEHRRAQCARQLLQVLMRKDERQPVFARLGQNILDVVGRVLLELVQVEIERLAKLLVFFVGATEGRFLDQRDDECTDQRAGALAQDAL